MEIDTGGSARERMLHILKRVISTKMSRKINYPSAERNKFFILEVLEKHFDKTKPGNVLEISSGTGQHAAYFASKFPKLAFQPSELETTLFDSIRAYASEVPAKNVKDPVTIDITTEPLTWEIANDFDYIINVNMFHVAPWSCSVGFFKNGSKVLKDGGLIVTYGPYAHNGVLEPESNVNFDRQLRARDPSCGVRDISDLQNVAKESGIQLMFIYDMPSNNKCLVWQKSNRADN